MSHRFVRLLCLSLCAAALAGCAATAAFNPVQGPLAARKPRPAYTAEINVFAGNVVVPLANGEVFKGTWHMIGPQAAAAPSAAGTSPPPDLTQDWDYVYGPGYFRAHVLGSPRYARALLTGSKGSTAVIEIFNEHGECGGAHGVASDSHHNVYKVTIYNEVCMSAGGFQSGIPGAPASAPAGHSTGPQMVVPATGGPPVLAIPVGAGVYQPVTGGAPTPGTPVN